MAELNKCPTCGDGWYRRSFSTEFNGEEVFFKCGTVTRCGKVTIPGRCELASRDAELARLRDEVERMTRQWAVMARAVGNWREFGQVNPETDQTEKDWLVAAQAIVDAESLRSEVKKLKNKLLREQVARHNEA